MKPQLLWDRYRGDQAQAVTVSELYEQVETFVQKLGAENPQAGELAAQGAYLSSALVPVVSSVPESASMLQSQNLTLEALALGMVAGAGDAFALSSSGECSEFAPFVFPDKKLTELAAILTKNLQQVRDTVSGQWSTAESGDLFLLAGYAKHENQNSLQEGAQVMKEQGQFPFQKFLLATFKGGYATGAVMSTAEYRRASEEAPREGL